MNSCPNLLAKTHAREDEAKHFYRLFAMLSLHQKYEAKNEPNLFSRDSNCKNDVPEYAKYAIDASAFC